MSIKINLQQLASQFWNEFPVIFIFWFNNFEQVNLPSDLELPSPQTTHLK